MARVTTLCDGAILVRSAVCIDGIRAVVLLVRFAVVAREIGTNLGSNASAIADLEILDLGTDFDDLADDFVAYAERKRDLFSPAAGDGVNVGRANTTCVDGNVDIIIFKLFQRELMDMLDQVEP